MQKCSGYGVAAWCLATMVVVLVAEVHETAAVNCNVVELTPCLGAIRGSEDPSPDCCSKLKEQVPCFCGYINNPMLRPYVDSPNAKKVAASCDVPTPKC